MLNFIWVILMAVSFLCALLTGNMPMLSESVLKGASDAVQLLISIAGIICFWSGMMELAEKSGIIQKIANVFAPFVSRLFKNVHKDSEAMKYISLNISANLLGLGNAATPFGLRAMKELDKSNKVKGTATDDMLLFVVMNTACIQLLPTTLCAYRASYSSASPFEILPSIWITCTVSLIVGIVVAKCFSLKV